MGARQRGIRSIVGIAVGFCLLAACGDDKPAASAVADPGATATMTVSDDQRSAVSDAAGSFAKELADLQATGAAALAPGGNPAAFYREFATVSTEAAARYADLDVPNEVRETRDRLAALLGEQASLLGEIADGADAGEDESLGPQLERLTEVLGDVTTVNAELLRSMGIEPPQPSP